MPLKLFLSVLLISLQSAGGCHSPSHRLGKSSSDFFVRGGFNPKEIVLNCKIVEKNTDLTFALYKQLVSQGSDLNVIFSPLRVSMILSLLTLGTHSVTRAQILMGLGFNLKEIQEDTIHKFFQNLILNLNLPSPDLDLYMGSALFVEERLRLLEDFSQNAKTTYMSETLNIDFQYPVRAQKRINDYISEQTHQKIVGLVKDVDASTMMILVDYIYFKASWDREFDPKRTKESDFIVSEKIIVKVPMMTHEDVHYYFRDRSLSCSVLHMTFASNESALFVLPDQGQMKRVEAALTQKIMKRWLKGLKKRAMELHIPKLSLSGKYAMQKILPALKITSLFSKESDVSSIIDLSNKPSHLTPLLTQMIQQAQFEMDETGPHTANKSYIKVKMSAARHHVLEFNRPFLVMVLTQPNQSILLLGKVVNPKEMEGSSAASST
ncbi:plasma serine protease inhibitor-like [Monodelphis domestica]|uniref:Plasma serine protease inhibitor-like n=1 Tax=Monodelphis domestica TaxID=13616 RepID=F6PYX9_MONDO|nr:plasma serine protease inhibitor-like [Monodelphis domestica]